MDNKYTVKSKKEANTLKAALCTKYPDAATTINDVFLSSDDGWVDVVVETENNLILNGWQSGAPAEWTINFNGDIVGYYNAECDIDNDFVESEDDIMDKVNNITNETVNNTTKGGIDMGKVNEEVAATVEVTIDEKAKAFAEGAKDKVVDVTKKVASTLSCIEEEAVKISSMNNATAETYIAENATEVLEKFKNGATKLLNNIGIIIEENPELEESLRKKAKSLSEFIEVIRDTLDEEGVNGWSKFKTIMKEVAKFVLGLILKAAAVVLKIAFTLVVGVIKIGATGLVTAGKVLGTLNREVVKPTTKDIKTTWANRKKKAEVTEDDFDEIEEELFQE